MPHEAEMHLLVKPMVLSSLLDRNTLTGEYLAASVIDRVDGGCPNRLVVQGEQ